MEVFGQVIGAVYDLFQIKFTIYGFTFSFWQIFVYTFVAGVILAFISEVFFDG